jgi:pentatricopeptide repeat protein
MNESGLHVNVETKTALLKGYAHSGQIAKGEALFESMCSAQCKSAQEPGGQIPPPVFDNSIDYSPYDRTGRSKK